jgi:hypothetical protein
VGTCPPPPPFFWRPLHLGRFATGALPRRCEARRRIFAFFRAREVLPQRGHDLRRQLSREGAARNWGSMSAPHGPASAPRESAALQEKSTTPEGAAPLGAKMGSSGFFTRATSTATTGHRAPSQRAASARQGSMKAIMAPSHGPSKGSFCREKAVRLRGPFLWVRRWARLPRSARTAPRRARRPHQGAATAGASSRSSVRPQKTSASAEEVARRLWAARTALPPRATFVSAQSGRPDSSPSGASQLRDSAGFAPDFAVSAPAGGYVPGDSSTAPALVDDSVRFGLTSRSSPVKVARSSPVGLRVRRTWRFREIDPLLHRGEVVR